MDKPPSWLRPAQADLQPVSKTRLPDMSEVGVDQIDCNIDQPATVKLIAGGISAPRVQTVELSLRLGGVASASITGKPPSVVSCFFHDRQATSNGSPPACQHALVKRPPKHWPALVDRDRPCTSDAAGRVDGGSHARRVTRVRPPRDVVKLEDRLQWLLEPPLESLLAAKALRFARNPFAYQLDGIAFLYPRHEALLADEMGLGKTMQAITAVRLLAHHHQLRRVLLVCPKSLVGNWRREFAEWAPELPVTVVEGEPARRQWLWRQAQDLVLIANYETVVRDAADLCCPGSSFDLIILDESQRIKNRASITNEVIRSIPRRRSWALTGTPIENSVDDLVGIFEFVAPGQIDADTKPRAIGRAVSDHVLRRTKEQVLADLPPKLFRDAEVDLTPEQAAAYQLAEKEGVVRLRALKHEITIKHVFELILRLKQICNFDPVSRASSKLDWLEADLEECAASGRKVIVFSQWVQTLGELRSRLARFSPIEFHGQIPPRRRDAVIEHFRTVDSCQVMLMSYGAGSVGLNLQFASYVFLFDRWWNPAVEDQAINRAHRIGAAHPVTVTRFLTAGTIEQRINQILVEKRELFDTVFGGSIAAPRSGLSRDDIFSLFDLTPPGHAPSVAD